MLQKDEIPQEVWEQAQAVASSMSPEERQNFVIKEMWQDCAMAYQEQMTTGKLSMADQVKIRQEFIASYPTRDLQKAAETVHDQFKKTLAVETLSPTWQRAIIPSLIGIVAILLLVICWEAATLI